MAGNITTIVSLPLSEEASLQSTIAGIKEIDGVAEVYYGRREEDKEIVTLAVDWADQANPEQLKNSILSGDLYETFKASLKGDISVFSFKHSSDPGTFVDSTNKPVTEIATFFLLPEISDEKITEFNTAVGALEKIILAQPGQFGTRAGHGLELLYNADIGTEVKAVIATVNWESIEAHTTFTQKPDFNEILGTVVPFLSGSSIFHVRFEKA